MKMSNNTVLITGGSAGIGLALAEEFLQRKNTVIICGRNADRLARAKQKYPQLHTIVCDVADEASITAMIQQVIGDHPKLNLLVNNAGSMHLHNVVKNSLAFEHQKQEIQTNILGTIHLCNTLLPHFLKQKNAAILNITSGLAYMPFSVSPVYTATKAAIHSYSQSMRLALKDTNVSIFEALPPMVDTDMSRGMEMKGMTKMAPEKLAGIIVNKMQKGKTEIRPGMAAMMIRMYKLMPAMINKMMGKMSPEILANIPKY